jgi:hypothetical protein
MLFCGDVLAGTALSKVPLWLSGKRFKTRGTHPARLLALGTGHRLGHVSPRPRLLLWPSLPSPVDEPFQGYRELNAASARSQRMPRIPIRYL